MAKKLEEQKVRTEPQMFNSFDFDDLAQAAMYLGKAVGSLKACGSNCAPKIKAQIEVLKQQLDDIVR